MTVGVTTHKKLAMATDKTSLKYSNPALTIFSQNNLNHKENSVELSHLNSTGTGHFNCLFHTFTDLVSSLRALIGWCLIPSFVNPYKT